MHIVYIPVPSSSYQDSFLKHVAHFSEIVANICPLVLPFVNILTVRINEILKIPSYSIFSSTSNITTDKKK